MGGGGPDDDGGIQLREKASPRDICGSTGLTEGIADSGTRERSALWSRRKSDMGKPLNLTHVLAS